MSLSTPIFTCALAGPPARLKAAATAVVQAMVRISSPPVGFPIAAATVPPSVRAETPGPSPRCRSHAASQSRDAVRRDRRAAAGFAPGRGARRLLRHPRLPARCQRAAAAGVAQPRLDHLPAGLQGPASHLAAARALYRAVLPRRGDRV